MNKKLLFIQKIIYSYDTIVKRKFKYHLYYCDKGITVSNTTNPATIERITLEKSTSSTSFRQGISGSPCKNNKKESLANNPKKNKPVRAIKSMTCFPVLPNRDSEIRPPSVRPKGINWSAFTSNEA